MALTIGYKDNRHPDNKNSDKCQTGRANQIEPDCWELLVTTRSLYQYPTQKAKNEDIDIKRSI
jgi:hypothetical protein